MMTPRERIQAALHGEWADRVPFTIYGNMLPRGEVERSLRNEGLAIIEWNQPYRIETPHVDVVFREYYEGGVLTRRETVRTPVGEVTSVEKCDARSYSGWWRVEYPIKRPEDYKVWEFVVHDTTYIPAYEAFVLMQDRLGQDGYVFGHGLPTVQVPMHYMMVELLGLERFSLELYDRPSDVLQLHDLIWQKHKEALAITVESPAELVEVGTNFHQAMMGPKLFEQYYMPYMNEWAEELHAAGKLAATHIDGDWHSLIPIVASSKLDVIEAISPPPMCDVSVAEARTALPDKVLWVNFPSAVHVSADEVIRAVTEQVLREAAPGDRFLFGVTEDVPETEWRRSLRTISSALQERGSLPLTS